MYDKEKAKKYYIDNKESIKAKARQYYYENIEKKKNIIMLTGLYMLISIKKRKKKII